MIIWFIMAILHRCPPGHDLRTGVRRDGSFECWPHPTGDDGADGTYGHPLCSTQSNAILRSKIYCTNGTMPIVVSDRIVGCQRGGWQQSDDD